jgi:glycosyltransferase involved in cell wall biosynthesis
MSRRSQEPPIPAANGTGVRILINAVAARMGGSATHLPNFLRTAGRRFPDETLIVCVNAQWRLPDLPLNIRVIRAGALEHRLAHAAWDLWGVVRVAVHEHADVLVSLLNFGPVRCPIPQIVFQRNPVYYCQDYLRTLSPLRALEIAATRALAHAVMRSSRRIITPSAAMREMIRRFHPDLPPAKFCVIPHGFGQEHFASGGALPADSPPPGAAAPSAGGLPPGVAETLQTSAGLRVLYVSHAAPYKGIEILLDAARHLNDRAFPSTVWLTVAREDWPEGVPRYQAFIREHGLAGRVKLLGRILHAAVPHLYEAADVFVYPSFCESFGFPLVEAMASGLPVVAADLPLNREMCGEAAVYYPPHDAAALAAAIMHLAADEPRRGAMAAAGRARAQQFSWDAHVDAVMTVARQAAGERPRVGAAGRGPVRR